MSSSHHSPDEAGHREQMKTLQAEMHAKMRAAREEKGLLIVHTGDGKGKTTAAFGMLVRQLGHGGRCAVIQFIKSKVDAVETCLAGPLLRWHRVGEGFTWDTQDREKDIERCREGWALAVSYLKSEDVDFLLLDELNIVLAFDYLPRTEVFEALRQKRRDQHVVVTGRGALPELTEMADLVTEMKDIKHPFRVGVKAQAGIEY